MFEIIKDGNVIAMTETINYIRLHPDGFYILCEKAEATGVAVDGVPYALWDGSLGDRETVVVFEVDGGARLAKLQAQENVSARIGGQVAAAAKMIVQDKTDIPDEIALQMPDMFRTWAEVLIAGTALAPQSVINKDGTLYRVQNIVVPMSHQPPDGEGMLALYRPIDPAHDGTEHDPIPWLYGMDCFAGLYYVRDGKTWLCVGNMTPCVWAPGSLGVWQWEEV